MQYKRTQNDLYLVKLESGDEIIKSLTTLPDKLTIAGQSLV